MTLSEEWYIEDIENEIIEYLNNKKKVFIESGSVNDMIVSYAVSTPFSKRQVIFTTSNCVFPLHINFKDQFFDSVYTKELEGNLFIEIS